MMKPSIPTNLIRVALLILTSSVLEASVFDEYLIAKWTFEDESLASETGGLLFREISFGANATMAFGEGTVNLGQGKLLACPELNSTAFPRLNKGMTLWMKFRILEEPVRTAFLAGFTNQAKPGDWPNLIFGISYIREDAAPGTGLRVLAAVEGEEPPVALVRPVPVRPGENLTVAAIFDSRERTLTLMVNGQAFHKQQHAQLGELKDFLNFGVGRLKEAGAAILEFDEVRVYSTAISPDWIKELSPDSSNPQPE